ncbi:MAG: hypothetical protein KAI67_02240 [Candidatus Pacebacteria bacterium]|nr:hypothetical protein [Candidatus Paceibacterota bacterium]
MYKEEIVKYNEKITNEEIIKHNKKITNNILILVISLMVSCIIIIIFTKPIYNNLKLGGFEIEAKEKSIESREFTLSRVMKIEVNDEYKTSVKKIEDLVSEGNQYEEYLANIANLANRRNIIINELQISDTEKKPIEKDVKSNFNSEAINVLATGEFSNFINFLEDIEKNMPLMEVNHLEIEKIDKKTDEVASLNSRLSFSVKINYFYY